MDGKTVSASWSKTTGFMTGNSSSFRVKRSREAYKRLPEVSNGKFENELFDLLDRQRTRSALRLSSQHSGCRTGSDDEPDIDSEGRLTILEDGERKPDGVKFLDVDSNRKDHTDNNLSMDSHKGRKRIKISKSGGWAYAGNEYTNKKGSGGDMVKNDKLEPYAYWQLDRKMMSRRPWQRAAARNEYQV